MAITESGSASLLSNIGAGVGTQKHAGKKELGQEDFLRLLVAQVNHQDPMEPQDNGEFIAQMAQFGTVDGIGKMQESLASLAQSMQSGQSLQQASSLVGRSVVIPSDTAYLTKDNTSIHGMIDLPGPASDINVSIYNEQGAVVNTVKLGEHNAGTMDFNWDGRLASGESAPVGRYSIRAQGFSGGQQKGLDTLVYAHVDSVSITTPGQSPLINARGIGPINIGDIRGIAQ